MCRGGFGEPTLGAPESRALKNLRPDQHYWVMTGSPEGPDWEELYTESFPRVYRAVLATVRDREVAKDAVQQAFLEGLRRPPSRQENLRLALPRCDSQGSA